MTTFLWYLFVKPYDYQAKMTVNSSPGFVYQAVVDWNKDLKMSRDIAINYANRNPFDEIEYEAEFSEIPLSFNWKIKENNDSTSFINIGINHKGNSVNERIHKLLSESKTEQVIQKELGQFYKGLEKYLKESRVTLHGRDTFKKSSVAYVSIQSLQDEKADMMIRNSEFIKTFLILHDIKLLSHPFINVKHWDFKTGKIDYDFCFPIAQMDNFPEHEEIKYKVVESMESLKANFFGNYSLSDRAWFDLHAFAGRNHIEVEPELIELYHNNPHEGGSSIDWKAEVFMKVK
jgi:effector-binding domain-containing protein